MLALTAMFTTGAQADAHFIGTGTPIWNLASPPPWDNVYPAAGDRAIFDRAGTGAVTNLLANRNVGQLVFMAPYTGPGFVSLTPPVTEGPITLMGLPGLAAGDPVLGVDDQVDQEIDLFDKMAVGGNQEWRISSAQGSIRQLNAVSGRGLNLNSFMLTLDPVHAANTFLLDDVISGTGGIIVTGAGTVTMTVANTYSGGTFLNGGILSVAADNNLGGAAGTLNFNGGTLRITGTAFQNTARTITWG
ncbi:MAG TPA: autotransporter-associated beta strand repeat-containing protein, partial [Rhizomicrobium sp.]